VRVNQEQTTGNYETNSYT